MIYIVVPTYNRVDICKAFVSSLKEQTFQDYQLILIDHGRIKTKIQEEKIITIESNVNGWAKAVNIGLNEILSFNDVKDSDAILIINDDVKLHKGYLESIVRSMKDKPDAILGTCCLDSSSQKTLRVAISLNRIKAKHIYMYQGIIREEIPYEYVESDVLTGKGTVIPYKILKQIGIYNEELLPHYKADHELIWRAKKMGVGVYAAKNMYLWTLSDQKTANGKEALLDTIKFMLFDMKSTINIRDWWNYAKLAYSKPYAVYFWILNFIRNYVGMFVDYIRTK